MIYNCRIKDHDGESHWVQITLRGMQHDECLIVSGVSMEAYHKGIRYAELLGYTKEMES